MANDTPSSTLNVKRFWCEPFRSVAVLEFESLLSESDAQSVREAIREASDYQTVIIVPNEPMPDVKGFVPDEYQH